MVPPSVWAAIVYDGDVTPDGQLSSLEGDVQHDGCDAHDAV